MRLKNIIKLARMYVRWIRPEFLEAGIIYAFLNKSGAEQNVWLIFNFSLASEPMN